MLTRMFKMPSRRILVNAFLSAIIIGVGAWTRLQRGRKRQQAIGASSSDTAIQASDSAKATERYLLYFTVPLWVAAGSLDYFWHRRTKIETTSGTLESAIHALMMTEAGIPMLLGLVLEINAGVILLMIAAFFAHAGTAIWDVAYAVERRKVTPNEQHVHSFLEVLPFCAVSFVICLHWDQFASLFGFSSEKSRVELKRKDPPLPATYLAGFLLAVMVNGTLYGEELVRCLRAQVRGLTGTETPAAAQELYASE